ncbi:AMP-binding protein [Nonomuraea sp. NPDC048901]|uniref:AMP-binding protein n=1 Tax=Nonomuraea sp. NPDC048901 TaxID=3155627 RepID=UPI0033E47DAF
MSDGAPVLRGPVVSYEHGEHIDEWIDRQASLHPAAPALRWRGQETSYADLVVDAETMAGALAKRGVGPGDVVPVRMRRGPRMVAALLAVLKRGAAYAAVPPDWPRARYEQLTDLVTPRVEITGAGGTLRHGVVTAATLLREGWRLPPAEPPERGSGTDPCCVFLTSGSTGTPKAVLAPHRGVIRTALDPLHTLDGPMNSLQSASVAWDVFAMELWVPLMRGGFCMLHEEGHLTAAGIRDAVAQGVNVLALPAVLFNAALDDDPRCLDGIELMVTGGERASGRHFAAGVREHPGMRLVHAYGPVESSICATAHLVTSAEEGEDVPIGRPVANTTVYLLDAEGRLSAPGELGEIAIGGDGLAIGYLGDPEATADRFPTLELDGEPRRVYLTGDLARIDDSGDLVFAGRRDRQIKLRGFRIELGEVEHVIERVPGVGRAAAFALPAGTRVPVRLAACYTTDAGTRVGPKALREDLLSRLPEAFVPDTLVPLAALPLLANGKVDYAALPGLLPDPDDAGGAAEQERDNPAPIGPELRTIMELAGDLLDRPIGQGDDLFVRGGTSLTAVRLANRIRVRLGQVIAAADILERRTPARIAKLLHPGSMTCAEAEDGSPDWLDGLPLNQYRFWLSEWLSPEHDQALIGMEYRLRGPLDRAALAAAVDTVVGWHESLHTRLPAVRRRPAIEILDPASLPSVFTVAEPAGDLAAARQLATAFARRRYHIGRETPLGVLLIPLGTDDHLLVLSAHHSGFDGWSEVLFWRDVGQVYADLVAGRRPPDRVPTSFHRVIAKQERWAAPRYDDACRFWADHLAGMPALPLPGPADEVGPAAELVLAIDQSLLERAARAAALAGGTVTALFLAAYVRALRAHTGADDFPVTVPVAARSIPETEDVIGCFASLITLRFPGLSAHPMAAVRAVADGLRAAVSSPVVPIDRFYDPPADAPRHPLLQVRFAMHDYAPGRIELPGITCEGERIGPARERSDVAFEVWPAPRPRAMLRYRSDVLTEPEARRLADRCLAEAESLVTSLSAGDSAIPRA